MKKVIRFILLGIMIMMQYSLSAQDTFIYGNKGGKMYFQEDANSIVISFKSQEYIEDSVGIAFIIKSIDENAQYEMLTQQMMKFQTNISFDSIATMLSDYSNELVVSKVYYPISDNHIHCCINRIVVALTSEELLRTPIPPAAPYSGHRIAVPNPQGDGKDDCGVFVI